MKPKVQKDQELANRKSDGDELLKLAGFLPAEPAVLKPLTGPERREREMLPDGLPRELARIEGYLRADDDEDDDGLGGDSRESFEYGSLGAWLNLRPEHDRENRRKLLEMIRRLKAAPSLKDHWLNLYTDVSEARQAALKAKLLIRFSFGSIVLDSMLAALMPVARLSAVDLKRATERVMNAAEMLTAELRHLRELGMDVRRFLPDSGDVIDELVKDDSDSPYGGAEMGVYFALRRYQRKLEDANADAKWESPMAYVRAAIAYVVCDTDSTLGTLCVISDRAKQYLNDGVRRRSLTGDKRIAWVMAEELARRFKRHLGNYRYARAAAIASAATGVNISGHALRVMTERAIKATPTRNRKR